MQVAVTFRGSGAGAEFVDESVSNHAPRVELILVQRSKAPRSKHESGIGVREQARMYSVDLASVDGVSLDAVIHPAEPSETRGTVIQAHGINSAMDEGGMYVRLAERLASAGFNALRFSFRGHGESGGTQAGVTIAGEMLDLQAAVAFARDTMPGPLSIVAASFGAVSTISSLAWLDDRLDRLVLWNPVLDLRRTFLEPELPWGLANFGPQQQEHLHAQGYLLLDEEFQVGRVLFEEFHRYRPAESLRTSRVPTLVVHGDRDGYVSYDIARHAARARAGSTFHTVVGSDHGFDSRGRQDEAINTTVDWLTTDLKGST